MSEPFQTFPLPSLDEEARELASTLGRDEFLKSVDLQHIWRDWFLSNTASKQFTWSREHAHKLMVYCRALEMGAEETGDPA